jgi:hypothetical protein
MISQKTLAKFTCFSVVPFLGFIALMAYVKIADPQIDVDSSGVHCPHISLFANIKVTALNNDGGCLIAFNDKYPYGGSVIGVAGDNSVIENGFDWFGVYFRSFNTAGKNDLSWTLKFSLWYLIILFGVLPAIFAMMKLRRTFLHSPQYCSPSSSDGEDSKKTAFKV